MKPIDFRNETFATLSLRVTGQRAAVFGAWQVHGPGTTAQLAERSKISILSLRPRTTELFDLGFICLAENQPAKGEGCYRVRTPAEYQRWSDEKISAANNPQRELALK